MKDFNLTVKFLDDPNWYTVAAVDFRFWKNHPADGINGNIQVLTNDGIIERDADYITEVMLNVW